MKNSQYNSLASDRYFRIYFTTNSKISLPWKSLSPNVSSASQRRSCLLDTSPDSFHLPLKLALPFFLSMLRARFQGHFSSPLRCALSVQLCLLMATPKEVEDTG